MITVLVAITGGCNKGKERLCACGVTVSVYVAGMCARTCFISLDTSGCGESTTVKPVATRERKRGPSNYS